MNYVVDLHLHSKYSRAVSQDMILPTMSRVGAEKGIDLLSASDWTHPLWLKEIKGQLVEKGEGIYQLAQPVTKKPVSFMLATEISSIYTQGGKLRRIHNLVLVPSFETAEKVIKELMRRGCNLLADGRPIVGLSSHDLLELILTIDERAILIPCHVWTPHFGLYGSASGFDSIEESFTDLADKIIAVETGLSSDPEMNWQIPELATRSIVSFSDAHSPAKMSREATVLELEELSYEQLRQALTIGEKKSKQSSHIVYTVEFYPEEGKYHFSGHRNCQTYFGPEEIHALGTLCPVCKRKLTEGVLFRVEQLSKKRVRAEEKMNNHGLKWYTDPSKTHPPYVKMVPLLEIIAESMHSTVQSLKVKAVYQKLITDCDTELTMLLKTPSETIAKIAGERVAEGVMKVRKGDISIRPGYDGEFGKVAIWQEGEEKKPVHAVGGPQLSLDL